MTLEAIRRQFPHTERSIYLNHAATGPLSKNVMEAMFRHMQQRHVGPIENFAEFQPVAQEALSHTARLIGTRPERVAFTPNTSHGLHLLAEGLSWQPGDRVAVPACEFPANVYPFMHLERMGVEVDFIPHEDAAFTLEAVERTLTPRTKLLSLSWVQFLSGFRADLEAVGRLCRERGIIFSVDAIQGLGALRLDVESMGIDFLSSGGQKWLMATQGSGFIYVSEALQEKITPPAGWLHGPVDWDHFFDYELRFHDSAARFQIGTQNSLGIAALGAALDLYFQAGPAWCEERVLGLSARLAGALGAAGMSRYGSDDPEHASGIVTVRHDDPAGLMRYLKEHSITVSVRNGLVRFSPTWYNTDEEIDRTVHLVEAYKDETVHA